MVEFTKKDNIKIPVYELAILTHQGTLYSKLDHNA